MGTGSTETVQAPEWITIEFLQDVLKEYYKDDTLVISDINIKSIGNTTDGFASERFRVSMNLKRKDFNGIFSVFIKVHPKGVTGVMAHKSKLFKREILTYTDILPRIQELLKSIGDDTKIAPICYYTTESPEPFIILEDLKSAGYENFEKGRLLNLDYILPTIEKLAKFHAASAVLVRDKPETLAFFNEAPISRNPDRKDFLTFFPVNIRCVAEEVAQWKGFEDIAAKIFTLAENVLQGAIAMNESHAHGFRVLNVADIWVQNLMFHINNETKEPDDVILFDFQLAYCGSPAADLNYFLYGSMNENVRKVHLKFVIHEYHRILFETLEKLNYNGHRPTLKEISIDIIKNSLQAVIAATCLTPIILMESENFKNLSEIFTRTEEGDILRRKNIENPKYRAFLQRTVKEFALNGFLDV